MQVSSVGHGWHRCLPYSPLSTTDLMKLFSMSGACIGGFSGPPAASASYKLLVTPDNRCSRIVDVCHDYELLQRICVIKTSGAVSSAVEGRGHIPPQHNLLTMFSCTGNACHGRQAGPEGGPDLQGRGEHGGDPDVLPARGRLREPGWAAVCSQQS